jgi:hypothetical protein
MGGVSMAQIMESNPGQRRATSFRNQSCVSVSGCSGEPSACATTNASSERCTPTQFLGLPQPVLPQFFDQSGGESQRPSLAALGRLVADLCSDLFRAFEDRKLAGGQINILPTKGGYLAAAHSAKDGK